MRRAALVGVLVLAGCGGEEREAAAPTPAGSTVTVTVQPGDTTTIRCPADDRCARLRRADFAPTAGNVACTEIYGGDATATVRGTVGGRRIDAAFDLTNGCEIRRWERFAWLLGEPPTGSP